MARATDGLNQAGMMKAVGRCSSKLWVGLLFAIGLTPTIIDKVYELLQQIRSQGVSLLIVEQNASRAFALADRACVMSRGAFTLTGTPAEIGRHEAFDAAYFGVAMAAGSGAA